MNKAPVMLEFFSSAGGAPFSPKSVKMIRLLLKGCTNRPFYHISVQEHFKERDDPVIEQLGTYDPLPNKHNEKLVSFNFQRLEYWLREGAIPTKSVTKLLGLAGYFPVHPESFSQAFMNRKLINEKLDELRKTATSLEQTNKNNLVLESMSAFSGLWPNCNSVNTMLTGQPYFPPMEI